MTNTEIQDVITKLQGMDPCITLQRAIAELTRFLRANEREAAAALKAMRAAERKAERVAWHERVRADREAAEAARAVGRERRRRKAEWQKKWAEWRAAGEKFTRRMCDGQLGPKDSVAPSWVEEYPIPPLDAYVAGTAEWPEPKVGTMWTWKSCP